MSGTRRVTMDLPIWLHESIKSYSREFNITQGRATAHLFAGLIKEVHGFRAANDKSEPDDMEAGE